MCLCVRVAVCVGACGRVSPVLYESHLAVKEITSDVQRCLLKTNSGIFPELQSSAVGAHIGEDNNGNRNCNSKRFQKTHNAPSFKVCLVASLP